MKFKIDFLTIQKLIDLYENDDLDLNPPYQRNEIWSMQSKKLLIDSIQIGFPLPNFFILEKNSKYEMVDGQQRSRTIIGYYKGFFPDKDDEFFDKETHKEFLNYKISVTYISDLDNSEAIENFYARVNSTGLKLNRPELNKAKYYDTRFLNLLETLSINHDFSDLNLFAEQSLARMNDIDFISEIVSQIKNGITDKKSGVDRLFENDINEEDFTKLSDRFKKVIGILKQFNDIYLIKKTRYKQKNDFYTLFGFINNNLNLKNDTFKYFYNVLVLIGEEISPSNDECESFKEYALHCVSQSNSKNAREERLKFFSELFLNKKNEPNAIQLDILKYFEIEKEPLQKKEDIYTLSAKKLQEIVKEPILIS